MPHCASVSGDHKDARGTKRMPWGATWYAVTSSLCQRWPYHPKGPHLTIEFQASSILNLTNVVNPVNPMPQLPFGNDLCHPPKIGRPLWDWLSHIIISQKTIETDVKNHYIISKKQINHTVVISKKTIKTQKKHRLQGATGGSKRWPCGPGSVARCPRCHRHRRRPNQSAAVAPRRMA
jgi:hypothetical protein